MRKVVIAVLMAAIGIGSGYYAAQYKGKGEVIPGWQEDDKIIYSQGFGIGLPSGWREGLPPQGAAFIAFKANEKITDPAAQDINFNSYYSVSYGVLEGRGRGEYVDYVKNVIRQSIPNIDFVSDQTVDVNGLPVYILEANIDQSDIEFKSMIALVKGKRDDVWTITFNCLSSDWPIYQPTFEEIINSFFLR